MLHQEYCKKPCQNHLLFLPLSLLLVASLNACSIFSSAPQSKPINQTGSFAVQMNMTANYIKTAVQYPVSGHLGSNTKFVNNQIIPAGSGVLGIYRNGGFSCSILWTAIIPLDGPPISNAKGIAYSSCPARGELSESSVISAHWN